MRNIALLLIYEGTAYHGWQRQQGLPMSGAAAGPTPGYTPNATWPISTRVPPFPWSGCPTP